MLKRFGVGAVLLVLAECLSGGAALADNFGRSLHRMLQVPMVLATTTQLVLRLKIKHWQSVLKMQRIARFESGLRIAVVLYRTMVLMLVGDWVILAPKLKAKQ